MKKCILMLSFLGLFISNHAQESVEIYPGQEEQTVVGFGAALAYYENWLNSHPRKTEVYEAIFGELSLDILRVRNAYDYDPDMIGRVKDYMDGAEAALGHPIKLFSTSWGPPGYLKNTGDRKNGGSLRYDIVDGKVEFDYGGFASWWMGSLDEYESEGILPDYITIQNEPNWSATWETCLFDPTERINSNDTIAGYNLALEAVSDSLALRDKQPLVLGPETVGIGYNNVQNYVNALDISRIDGISHHLYHGVDENNPYASNTFKEVGDFHPEIPHFQTEYSRGDWWSLAGLIYKSFFDEGVVAYVYWDLIWNEGGLVTLENPWNSGSWTTAGGWFRTREFYAFKQFSAFIHPGWKMVEHEQSAGGVATLTFVSDDRDSAACVLINRNSVAHEMHLSLPGYRISSSEIYRTSESLECAYIGALADSSLSLPGISITTVAMDIAVYDPGDDIEAPLVPVGLDTLSLSDTELMLAWEASSDNIGVKGYRVYLDGALWGSTNDTVLLIDGLQPETTYLFSVSAFDDAGNESERSQDLQLTTLFVDREPPTVPGNLELLSLGEAQVELSWQASSDNVGVVSYVVYLDGVLNMNPVHPPVVIDGLNAGTAYSIQVSALDAEGNESELGEALQFTTLYFDRVAPQVSVSDSVFRGEGLELMSNEEGLAYIVPEDTPAGLAEIRSAGIDSLSLEAGVAQILTLEDYDNGMYWVYATDSALNISVPAAFTVYGVGVENYLPDDFRVYPNPASERIILEMQLAHKQGLIFRIYDQLGRMLKEEDLGELQPGRIHIPVSLSGLPEGTCLYWIGDARGRGRYGKLMIRRPD